MNSSNPLKTLFNAMLSLLAVFACTGCGETTADRPKPPIPVTVGIVGDQNRASSLKYSGVIEPGTIVPVAFRTGGYVKAIAHGNGSDADRLLQAGDRVASGAFLAQVEDREYLLQVSRARAGALEARSGLLSVKAQAAAARNTAQQARDEYARAERLFASDSITRLEFDTARTRSRNADEALAAAEAAVRGVEAKIQGAEAIVREVESITFDTAVRAPLDGNILARSIEPGALVGPGTVAFLVAQLDPVKLRFSLPDRFLDKVAIGDAREATLDMQPETRIRGRITKIALTADPRTRLFDVEMTVPKPEGALRPGMIVQVEINSPGTPGLGLIPLEAIVPGASGEQSFAIFQVASETGKAIARKTEVRLGRPFGNLIAVESGIRPGDTFILSGAAFLEDGDPFHIVEESF